MTLGVTRGCPQLPGWWSWHARCTKAPRATWFGPRKEWNVIGILLFGLSAPFAHAAASPTPSFLVPGLLQQSTRTGEIMVLGQAPTVSSLSQALTLVEPASAPTQAPVMTNVFAFDNFNQSGIVWPQANLPQVSMLQIPPMVAGGPQTDPSFHVDDSTQRWITRNQVSAAL